MCEYLTVYPTVCSLPLLVVSRVKPEAECLPRVGSGPLDLEDWNRDLPLVETSIGSRNQWPPCKTGIFLNEASFDIHGKNDQEWAAWLSPCNNYTA